MNIDISKDASTLNLYRHNAHAENILTICSCITKLRAAQCWSYFGWTCVCDS